MEYDMGMQPKYIIVCLEERNGEYEYRHKSVHELPEGATDAISMGARFLLS